MIIMSNDINVRARYTDEVSPGIKKTQQNTKQATTAMQAQFNQLSTAVKGVVGAYVGLRGAQAVFSFAKESTRLAIVQEEAENDLASTLRAKGANIQKLLPSMKAYGAELQAQTIYGDEALITLMAYGGNLGVQTGQMKDATKAAVGLAAKYRLDLNSAMQLVGRASQGQTQMLSRYGIVLKEGTSDQEKFNEVLKLGSDAFSIAKDQTKSAAGQMKQYANELGDAKEVMGMQLIPVQLAFTKGLTVMISKLSEFFKVSKDGWGSQDDLQKQIWQNQITHARSLQNEIEKIAVANAPGKLFFQSKEDEEKFNRLEESIKRARLELEKMSGADAKSPESGPAKLKQSPILSILPPEEEFKDQSAILQDAYRGFTDSKLALIEDSAEREKAILQEQMTRELQDVGDNYQARLLIIKKFANESALLDKDAAKEKEKNLKQTTRDVIGNALDITSMFKDNNKQMFVFNKGLAVAQATMNTFTAATKALDQGGPIAGPIMMGSIIALGMAQVGKIMSTEYKAALGADFTTSGPTRLLVGDNPGGRERVQVTPLSSPNINGPQGQSINADMSVIINGNADASTVSMISANQENRLKELRSMLQELNFRGQGVVA